MSANVAQPLPEIMTVEDVSAMLCKSVSTIYAMTSERRIPYRKQGNKLYFMRTEIKSWLNDSVMPKDAPKRKSGHEAKDCTNSPDEPAPENEVVQSDAVSGTEDLQASTSISGNGIESEQQNPPYIIEQRTHSRNGAEILPCVSPMNMKQPENGSSTRKHGSSTATGATTGTADMCSLPRRMQSDLPTR